MRPPDLEGRDLAPGAMIATLDSLRGTLPNVPALVDLQKRQVRFDYVRDLSDTDQQRVYADLIDNRMFGQPGRAFLRHYYRRDQARMSAAAFNESPDDTAIHSNPCTATTARSRAVSAQRS